MKYAISGYASHIKLNCVNSQVYLAFVEASSQLEAEGLGMRIVRKLYKQEKGWSHHSCGARSVDEPTITEQTASLAYPVD